MIFRKPRNALEGQSLPQIPETGEIDHEPPVICPVCKKESTPEELDNAFFVCPYCRYHFRINARQRISIIADAGTFVEIGKDMLPDNFLDFPGYGKKIEAAKLQSAEDESVVCGDCEIDGNKTAIFVMEPFFMMGSMGKVTGEKITATFERARENDSPVVGFTVSGGARMQEGATALMQMAKTSGAVKRHSDAGGLFVCVLTDPTTGGVTASFAMEADIITAEPRALIGFAGPRVIEHTIRKKLPAGFQRAEFQLDHGFIDSITDRKRQKKYIAQLLQMHRKETV